MYEYSIHADLDTKNRLRVILNLDENILEVFYITPKDEYSSLKRFFQVQKLWSEKYGFGNEYNFYYYLGNDAWIKEYSYLYRYLISHKFETGDVVDCGDGSYGIIIDIEGEQNAPDKLNPYALSPQVTVLRGSQFSLHQVKKYKLINLALADEAVLYHTEFIKLRYSNLRSNVVTDVVNDTIEHLKLMVLEQAFPHRIGNHVHYRDIHGVILRFVEINDDEVHYRVTPPYRTLLNGGEIYADVIIASSQILNHGIPCRINIKQLSIAPLSESQVNSLYLLSEEEDETLDACVSLFNTAVVNT